MQEKTRKLIMLISLAVAVVVAVCAILFAANQEKFGGLFDVAFWVLVCYIVCSLLIWLFYGIISVTKKPKKAGIFAGVVVLVIVAGVLLGLTDSAMPTDLLQKYSVSVSASKLIGIACYITYITVIGALVLMIYSAVSKALKK
ncbi:MAG: hypothetical protein IJR26_04615 [Bacteroidales bacterium]|nr:hypothetical protein [Bacteroidales bacterium]